MSNVIPGANILGHGFNILGEFSVSSVTQQIFKHQELASEGWTYAPTGVTYDVPDNTSVTPATSSSGAAQVFNSRQQFQNYLAAKAGASVSYGCFSGEFNAAYSETFDSDRSYYYGLYEMNYTGWTMMLDEQTTDWLADGFINDPDVKDLPTQFTAENREKFFNLFRRFGTHYVTQVTVGGRFDYFVAVETSYTSSMQQVETNIELEYDALFVEATASAWAKWQYLGTSWASSRKCRVNAVGGDTGSLNALSPSFGDSDSAAFSAWAQAVMTSPAVIGFSLRPLSALFSGDKSTAVQQALAAYTNGAIIATANSDYTPGQGPSGGNFTTSNSILVNGRIIAPDPFVAPPQPDKFPGGTVVPVGGYQIALLDSSTLEPILSRMYYQVFGTVATMSSIYQYMLNDIGGVKEKGYVAVVTAFGLNMLNYPTGPFAEWLSSCGATLRDWKKYVSLTGQPGQVSYVMIGQQGLMPGNAVEDFAVATDWAGAPAASTTDASALVLLHADSPFIRTPGKQAFGTLRRGAVAAAV